MSTETTPKRGQGRPPKSRTTNDQLNLSSSPIACPEKPSPLASIPIVSTISPVLKPRSTSSSISSKASTVSDASSSTSRQTESSTTTRSESPPLPIRKPLIIMDSSPKSSTSPLSSPRLKIGRKRQTAGWIPESLEDATMPSRRASKLPKGNRKRVSLDQASNLQTSQSLQLPPSETTRQRASSAPTPASKRDEPSDLYGLELPGTYVESQNSDNDIGSTSQWQEIEPLKTYRQYQLDDDTRFTSIPEDDSGDDEVSEASETTVEEVSLTDGITSEAPGGSLDEHAKDEAECPRLPFRPYSCKRGRPKNRDHKEAHWINFKIIQLVSQKQKKGKPGWVYVFESEEYGPDFLKIGCSDAPSHKRRVNLEDRCKMHLQELPDNFKNSFYYYSLVERLVHEELHNARLKYKCSQCGKEHKEWFEVDRQVALKAVEKWRNWFIVHRPFDAGELTPFWQWKVNQIRNYEADIKWEEWTQPPAHEFYIFPFKAHFARSRKDGVFLSVGTLLVLISYFGQGSKGAIWAFIALLLL